MNSNGITSDFSETLNILDSIPDSRTNTDPIKNELNLFFNDSECKEVLITDNDDKMFFGIKVFPEKVYEDDRTKDVIQILTEPKSKRVRSYSVEIDSQLFKICMLNTITGSTAYCILALIIREVSGLIKDSSPVDKVKNAINNYLTVNGTTISITKTAQYNELFWFGLCDAMYKLSSVLYTDLNSEFIADEFARTYGTDSNLETMVSIIKKSGVLNNQIDSRLIVLEWALRLYKDVRRFRIDALETIKECLALSGSQLEKRRLNRLASQIRTIDDSLLLNEYGELIESQVLMGSKDIPSIISDLYEYALRIKTVTQKEDKDILMREINANITILDDQINQRESDEYSRNALVNTYNQYISLREKLANKQVSDEPVIDDSDPMSTTIAEVMYDKYWL